MDYFATPIDPGEKFSLTGDDELWVYSRDLGHMCTKWVNPAAIQWVDGRLLGYGKDYRSFPLDPGTQHLEVERDIDLVWRPTRVRPLVHSVSPLSYPLHAPQSQPDQFYEVYGTAAKEGHESWDLGPLDITGHDAGRLVVEITDCVRTESSGLWSGSFGISTSHDGSEWTQTPHKGLTRGMMFIDQSTTYTGAWYADEISFAGLRRYIRINYRPGLIAGWAFRFSITYEARNTRS